MAMNKAGNVLVMGTPDFMGQSGKVAIFEYAGELVVPDPIDTLESATFISSCRIKPRVPKCLITRQAEEVHVYT